MVPVPYKKKLSAIVIAFSSRVKTAEYFAPSLISCYSNYTTVIKQDVLRPACLHSHYSEIFMNIKKMLTLRDFLHSLKYVLPLLRYGYL